MDSNQKVSRAATVNLQGFIHEDGRLYAFFGDACHNWCLECCAKNLQSFKAFQAHVAQELGFWINHKSQFFISQHPRVAAWSNAVLCAFRRGATA